MTASREFAPAGVTTNPVVLLVMLSLVLIGALALEPPADVVLDGAWPRN